MGGTQQNDADGNQTFYASNGSCTFLAGQKNGPAQSCSGQCTNGQMTNGVASADCGGGSLALFYYDGDPGALGPGGSYAGGGSGFDCSANPGSPLCFTGPPVCDATSFSDYTGYLQCLESSVTCGSSMTPATLWCKMLSDDAIDPIIINAAPTFYKTFPSVGNIYFNEPHYWYQHIACKIPGLTEDQLRNAVADVINADKTGAQAWRTWWPMMEVYETVVITDSNGHSITLAVLGVTGAMFNGDFVINTIYPISTLANC